MFSGLTNFINNIQTDPLGTIVTLLYTSVCIIFSLILNECAHGYFGLKCGVPTEKMLA